MGKPFRPLVDRFWDKVVKSSTPDACWAWLTSKTGANEAGGEAYSEAGRKVGRGSDRARRRRLRLDGDAMRKQRYPLQPVVWDGEGVIRFQANPTPALAEPNVTTRNECP